MKPLNAREWLEAQHLAGNPWALDLIELIDSEDAARECADAINDLKDKAPNKIKESPDLWRLVEWIGDRLALLNEVEALAAERCEGVASANGSKPLDVAEILTAAFDCDRWQEYDL